VVVLSNGSALRSCRAINATYAGLNSVLALFGAPPMPLKYELCEVCLGRASSGLRSIGITLMDGPFFSLMPFGHSGFHSFTSVDHTPRQACNDVLPVFSCQSKNPYCRPDRLANCGNCPSRPFGAWPYMRQLTRKYLRDSLTVSYEESLHTVKAILRTSEIDDGRPTLIRTYAPGPELISVLSGKLTTFYDIEDVL